MQAVSVELYTHVVRSLSSHGKVLRDAADEREVPTSFRVRDCPISVFVGRFQQVCLPSRGQNARIPRTVRISLPYSHSQVRARHHLSSCLFLSPRLTRRSDASSTRWAAVRRSTVWIWSKERSCLRSLRTAPS